ncbi:hypothetical protein PSPO01_02537 [Paraphaeosphaeria sporulosa]
MQRACHGVQIRGRRATAALKLHGGSGTVLAGGGPRGGRTQLFLGGCAGVAGRSSAEAWSSDQARPWLCGQEDPGEGDPLQVLGAGQLRCAVQLRREEERPIWDDHRDPRRWSVAGTGAGTDHTAREGRGACAMMLLAGQGGRGRGSTSAARPGALARVHELRGGPDCALLGSRVREAAQG